MKTALKYMVIGLAVLTLFVFMTNPSTLPPIALMVPFILLFGLLATGIAALLAWSHGSLQPRHFRAGALAAAFPMVLLVLNSMGQLTVRDVLTISALFGVIYFYISRFRTPARS